ncbi:F-box protein PP2-B13-like, partial [Asparagus officinalis]|uniref:F-box protein PP2-B13-like n=1 Tax=Asparagus officinalis TaxID=4686 RepID=UPI00098E8557
PSDHREILSSAVDPVRFSTKKELYRRLCDSILIDGGNISFGLDKGSGKKRIVTSVRGLSIVWGDAPRYWKWKEAENSRFAEVAELTSVCWLEIKATINTDILSPRTTYRAYLIFNTVRGSYGLTFPTQETSIKIGSQVISKHNVCLQPDVSDPPKPCLTLLGRSAVFRVPPRPADSDGPVQSPVTRGDGWMELEMGRFFIEEGKGCEVEISLTEIKGGHWKRGLVVQGIELRPVE